MSLLKAGGWVTASAIGGDAVGTPCTFCGGRLDDRGGWVSVLLQAFVCGRCLPDPDAEGAGQRAAERLAARREADERERREAWPFSQGWDAVGNEAVSSTATLDSS
jgi:hypothetical protein